MCLMIKSGPHIAKEPIVVWKALRFFYFDKCGNKKRYRGKVGYSPLHNFKYEEETLYTTTLSGFFGEIHEGFHAYLNFQDTEYLIGKKERAAAFVIPKGATYFLGTSGDIVSNQIMSGSFSDEFLIEVSPCA